MTLVLAIISVTPTSLKFTEPTSQLTFTLSNTDTVNAVTYIVTPPTTIIQENGQPIVFSMTPSATIGNPPGTYTLPAATLSTPSTLLMAVNANIDFNEINVGKTYSGNIVVKKCTSSSDCASTTETLNIPITITSSFCSAGEQGTDLEISDVSIDNNDGDDYEWTQLDEVEISVEVSNNGTEKVKDVFVTLGIYNSAGKNIVKDMEDLDDDEIKLGSINDGDEDIATFKFMVPSDFESGSFRLVVKAYGDDIGENLLCVAHASDLDNNVYQSITGDRE